MPEINFSILRGLFDFNYSSVLSRNGFKVDLIFAGLSIPIAD